MKKIFILYITIFLLLIVKSSLIIGQTESSNTNNGIGRGLDNRSKDNIYRDEIKLEGIISLPEDYEKIITNKPKDIEQFYVDISSFYDEPFTPELKKEYTKPEKRYYEKWDSYSSTGVNQLIENDIAKNLHTNYFIEYINNKTKDRIRVESYKNKIHTDSYIYNNNKKLITIHMIFSKIGELLQYKDFIYNPNDNISRENIYINGKLSNYITTEYYSKDKLKTKRNYAYDSIPTGEWLYYNKSETLDKKEIYKEGLFFSLIKYYYNESGIEIKREYYNKNYELLKYWIRENGKILYYDSENNTISWKDFINK